jgi:hypothetical protein
MVRAIEYTKENLPQIQEAYPGDADRFQVEDFKPYENDLYYFVHDTNRMQVNFVMTYAELAMVYDIYPKYQGGKTTFFRID